MASLVQYNDNLVSSAANIVANSALNVTAGNFLVVVISTWNDTDNSNIITGVADTALNTYKKATGAYVTGVNAERCEIWYAENINHHAANITTVTFTANTWSKYLSVAEFSGIKTSSSLLNVSSKSNINVANHTSNAVLSSNAGDLIIGGYRSVDSKNATVGGGFTSLSSSLTSITNFSEYKITGNRGNYVATALTDSTTNSIMVGAIFGTAKSVASTPWSGLGMNIGFDIVTNAEFDILWNKGIRKIRVGYPGYIVGGPYADAFDTITRALAKGFNVVWGITAGANYTGTQWSEFKTEVQRLAGDVQGFNNSNFQFSVGNEEELSNNGAAAPSDATVRTDLIALAATCQGIYTKGKISVEVDINEVSYWVALAGSITPGTNLDLIGLNVYSADGRWSAGIDSWAATFGVNGYISEFNWGNMFILPDETQQVNYVSELFEYIRNSGLPTAFFFTLNDWVDNYYGAKKLDASYRLIWDVLIVNGNRLNTIKGVNISRTGSQTRTTTGTRTIPGTRTLV